MFVLRFDDDFLAQWRGCQVDVPPNRFGERETNAFFCGGESLQLEKQSVIGRRKKCKAIAAVLACDRTVSSLKRTRVDGDRDSGERLAGSRDASGQLGSRPLLRAARHGNEQRENRGPPFQRFTL